jgi:hypothetical protein
MFYVLFETELLQVIICGRLDVTNTNYAANSCIPGAK